jgi:hypothetical protein
MSKLNRAWAALTWANSTRHIRISPSPWILPAPFTGISRIRITANASKS